MPNFILFISFLVAVFGGSFVALGTDSPAIVALALIFACACGMLGSRLALMADQANTLRNTLRNIRSGKVPLINSNPLHV